MDVKFYPCCRALARIKYTAFRGQYKTDNKALIEKGLELIRENPMVVITGSDQKDFDRNCRLAKTTLAKAIGITLMWNMDQAVLWLDFEEELIRRHGRTTRLFESRDFRFHKIGGTDKLTPKPGYVCFVDEAHFMFPYAVVNPGVATDSRIAASFMRRVPALLKKGVKFVFITSANPLDELYRERVVSRELVGFFTAPIIELDADGPAFRARFVIR